MRKFLGLLSWLILAGAAHAASVTAYDLQRPEGARHVLVGLPEGNRPGKHPLIILLHGHGGTASQLLGLKGSAAPLSVWLKIADREGWVVAAPHGLDGSDGMAGWNDCRKDAASNPQADDVGLIGAIIDREVATDNVDPDRVFVMGMSNGAMMTFRAAVELGDRLAGFATVSGSMAKVSECAAPKTPLSGLIISGTADPIVPYGGGDVRILGMPRGSVIPVEQSVKNWRIFDGLPAQAVSVSSLSPPRRRPDLGDAHRLGQRSGRAAGGIPAHRRRRPCRAQPEPAHQRSLRAGRRPAKRRCRNRRGSFRLLQGQAQGALRRGLAFCRVLADPGRIRPRSKQ